MSSALQPVQRSSSATSPSPNPFAPAADGRGGLERSRVRVRLVLPIVSLLVGAALVLAEVVIILLVLAFPKVVGITTSAWPKTAHLTGAQRAVLGVTSLVMVVEAIIIGIVDTGRERRRVRAVKTQYQHAEKHLARLKETIRSQAGGEDETHGSHQPSLSTGQLGELLVDQPDLSQSLSVRAVPARLREEVAEVQTQEEVRALERELNYDTVQYAAALVFDLASFLWKWAVAILVIRNRWVIVGVAAVGGVVYPVIGLWKKNLVPKNWGLTGGVTTPIQ